MEAMKRAFSIPLSGKKDSPSKTSGGLFSKKSEKLEKFPKEKEEKQLEKTEKKAEKSVEKGKDFSDLTSEQLLTLLQKTWRERDEWKGEAENNQSERERLNLMYEDVLSENDEMSSKISRISNLVYPVWEKTFRIKKETRVRQIADEYGVNPKVKRKEDILKEPVKLVEALCRVIYYDDLKAQENFDRWAEEASKVSKIEREKREIQAQLDEYKRKVPNPDFMQEELHTLKVENDAFKKKERTLIKHLKEKEEEWKEKEEQMQFTLEQANREIERLKEELASKPAFIEVAVSSVKEETKSSFDDYLEEEETIEEEVIKEEELIVEKVLAEEISSELPSTEISIEVEVEPEIFEEEVLETVEEVVGIIEEKESDAQKEEEFSIESLLAQAEEMERLEELAKIKEEEEKEQKSIVEDYPYIHHLKKWGYEVHRAKEKVHDLTVEFESEQAIPLCYINYELTDGEIFDKALASGNKLHMVFATKKFYDVGNRKFTTWLMKSGRRKEVEFSFTTVEQLEQNGLSKLRKL